MLTKLPNGNTRWTPDTWFGSVALYVFAVIVWTMTTVVLVLPGIVVLGGLYGIGRLLKFW